MSATPLESAAEVLVATAHDPFARASLRRPVVRGWVGHGATAWLGVDPEERRSYLSALGDPGAVAALVAELLPELPVRQRVTLPRGTAARLPAWVGLGEGAADWDFRWVAGALPQQAGEDRVVGGVEDGPVQRLLQVAGPGASVQPGEAAARRWWGVPDAGGELLACAADTSAATGVGHVSAVAVRPEARRRGLGRAVTAALARALLADGADVVTLGVYASNTAGRRLYDALGFHDDHRFTSGPLVQRGRW